MKKFKSQAFFKLLALFFLIAYLAGSFTCMVCAPAYASAPACAARARGLHFTRPVSDAKFHPANFFRIFDKTTFENDQFDNTLRYAPKCLVLVFTAQGLPGAAKRLSRRPQNVIHNHQYAYLSFCTFRI